MRLGNDGEDCWHGRKNKWGSVVCYFILLFCRLMNVSGRRTRKLHVSSKYKVFSAYNYLLSTDQPINVDHSNNFWHKKVHLKVNLFAWPLLRNRIPTTYNLNKWRYFNQILRMCNQLWQRGGYQPSFFVLRLLQQSLVWHL